MQINMEKQKTEKCLFLLLKSVDNSLKRIDIIILEFLPKIQLQFFSG